MGLFRRVTGQLYFLWHLLKDRDKEHVCQDGGSFPTSTDFQPLLQHTKDHESPYGCLNACAVALLIAKYIDNA
jgi:hypothetical protein